MSRSSRNKSRDTVLVIAAHPDDEVLGCGATIAKHAKAGNSVHILILGEGITSRDTGKSLDSSQKKLDRLKTSAKHAAQILGAKSSTLHDFPDNRMDTVALLDIVKIVESHISHVRPTIVYTHDAHDVNIDHRRVHEAVVTACRPQSRHSVSTLLFFEVASSTEWRPGGSSKTFSPSWFEDISHTLNLKLKALRSYASEMRPFPHPRSYEAITHLARWRGASSGFNAAEAFVLGRYRGGKL